MLISDFFINFAVANQQNSCKNSFYEDHFSEAARLTLNDWIRANKDVDGVIDFDVAVRDPQNPSALRPEFSDDWLHLNPSGYEAMGKFAAEALK